MGIAVNQIFVSGIPFEFATASEIHIARGSQPFEWKFLVTDKEPWSALTNPVVIEIITSGPDGEATKLVLEKWYITSIEADVSGMYEVTIQDARWPLQRKVFQRSYNITTLERKLRPASALDNFNASWSCISAAENALLSMGATVKISPELKNSVKNIILPENLGDSEAGGFTAGTIRDVEAFLELCRCDMTIDRKGNIVIVDRSTNISQGLDETPTFSGKVGPKDVHWTLPKKINVTFEQRVERIFEANLGTGVTATPVQIYDMAIENVAPDFDQSDFPQLRADGTEIVNWLTVERFVQERLNQTYSVFLSRFLKDSGIEEGPGLIDQDLFDKRQLEAIARDSTFKVWKVNLSTVQGGRGWAKMKLGRLGPNGLTLPGGGVFCDWSEYNRFSWVDPSKTDLDIANHRFSRQHKYPSTESNKTAAPFSAEWVSDGIHALVFRLSPKRLPNQLKEIVAGLITPDISYGDAKDIIDGKDTLHLEHQSETADDFHLKVYWHGLLATDFGQYKRLHTVQKDGFANGQVESITIKAENITANWGYDGGVFPGTLLNQAELDKRASYIAQQVKQTYESGKSGMMLASGVYHLVGSDKYWTSGNLYDVVIEIGQEQSYTVNTRFIFLPEVRSSIINDPDSLDGRPPEVIA